jgi:hypothetical protein
MTADDAFRPSFFVDRPQNLRENFRIALFRKPTIDSAESPSTHGINIAERIGCRDLAERAGSPSA